MQLQLYGRGLARAFSMPVRERLVLFTAIARTVPGLRPARRRPLPARSHVGASPAVLT